MTNRYVYVPDLVADMAECDANYIRLGKLFPGMDLKNDIEFGIRTQTEEGAIVVIKIQKRCPFTTMVSVTVSSEIEKPFIRWPSFDVRVYHDVNSAEVVRFERHSSFRFLYSAPNDLMFQPDEKSQINKYLGELLTFCIEHGYSLEPVEFF